MDCVIKYVLYISVECTEVLEKARLQQNANATQCRWVMLEFMKHRNEVYCLIMSIGKF